VKQVEGGWVGSDVGEVRVPVKADRWGETVRVGPFGRRGG